MSATDGPVLPGDKSISHRSLLLAALARGESRIEARNHGDDVEATAAVLRALGVGVDEADGATHVRPARLKSPTLPLQCGNSGTTARLVAGLLVGAGVPAELVGDASLSRRPMSRVRAPLEALAGVRVLHVSDPGTLPMTVLPSVAATWPGGVVETGVASAQVKSAVLLAALAAGREVTVVEPRPTRAHTERMLRALGVPVENQGPCTVHLPAGPHIVMPQAVRIPGDASAAAVWAATCVMRPGAEVRLSDVSLAEGRLGWVSALQQMGAHIECKSTGSVLGESVGTVCVTAPAQLRPLLLATDDVPSVIDEVPLLAAVATQAHGVSAFSGLGELQHKESDRLAGIVSGLLAMGADVGRDGDSLLVRGGRPLSATAAAVSAHRDHRLEMAWMALAGVTGCAATIEDGGVTPVSWPGFVTDLAGLLSSLPPAAVDR